MPGYGFSDSVITVVFPILDCKFFGRIGIAIFTLVGAGIVFSNVFACDTATGQALSFIFVTFLMYNMHWVEKSFIMDFDSEVVHQYFVICKISGYQVIIYATVMLYTNLFRVYL